MLHDVCDTGTRNLQDDLNDVLAHIPLDEVLAIGLDYLANDQEVQELVIYLQSAEFHKIVLTVEAVPEFDEVSITVYVFVCLLYKLQLDMKFILLTSDWFMCCYF